VGQACTDPSHRILDTRPFAYFPTSLLSSFPNFPLPHFPAIIPPMNVPLRQYWHLLVRYLASQRLAALGLAVLLLASIALQLANPQILRAFLDGAQTGAPPQTLLHLALGFLGVALVQQAAVVGATYLGENVAWTATNALRGELADHCLRLDMYFHKAHKPGELIERIDGDVTALSNFFSQFFIQVVGNGLLLAGVLALLVREDWRVGAVVGFFALGALVVLARLRNIAVPHWAAERQASSELFGFLEERLAGTEEIRANGAEAHAMRGFYVHMRELLRRSLKAGLMSNFMLNSSILLFALATAAAFAVGAERYYAGALTIGSVYIVFHYTNMLERPINHIVRQVQDLQKAGASIVRVQGLLALEPRLEIRGLPTTAAVEGTPEAVEGTPEAVTTNLLSNLSLRGARLWRRSNPRRCREWRLPPRVLVAVLRRSQTALAPRNDRVLRSASRTSAMDDLAVTSFPEGPLAVTFDHVSFEYHDETSAVMPAQSGSEAPETPGDGEGPSPDPAPEPVLHDVGFTLAPGRVLGLLGRTGSGKTTVTRLLFRLYDPDKGAVRLGGADLRNLPLAELRRRVGLVTQNIQLFHATVRDNLTFFDRGVRDARILAVLRDLGLEDWVRGLPGGLDTVLESGGGGLSAGQAQLLAFARVFLQDPGLVILDEASSRLDPATEALLERAVDRLLAGRTAILVAHRLGTVQRADEILILEGGRVKEHGVRAELARDPNSHFAQLLRTGMEEVLA
jgi:ABC-type multidrug transport system fused ATPase/permease subunit